MPIGLKHDYVTRSKFTHKPRCDKFSQTSGTFVLFSPGHFFSSLLLWEMFYNKIYNLHLQSELGREIIWLSNIYKCKAYSR